MDSVLPTVNISRTLKESARSQLSPLLARLGRKAFSHLRYRKQLRQCQQGFQQYGSRYPHKTLFVAGLPKSGTSWMESMLASYPGFHHIMLPEAVSYELAHGGSHDFQLPNDLQSRLDGALAVLKLHVKGTAHNAEQLRQAGFPYLIMYRDLRDVAVSHYFYVRRTPWHPEYEVYSDLDVEDGLIHFGKTLLPAFDDWVRSWHREREKDQSLIVRYEDLLDDTESVFSSVASLYGLDDSKQRVRKIVEAHSFENVSGGREKGNQSEESFYRKGVSGDWKNHFTDCVERVFKEEAGEFWVDHGYEDTHDW